LDESGDDFASLFLFLKASLRVRVNSRSKDGETRTRLDRFPVRGVFSFLVHASPRFPPPEPFFFPSPETLRSPLRHRGSALMWLDFSRRGRKDSFCISLENHVLFSCFFVFSYKRFRPPQGAVCSSSLQAVSPVVFRLSNGAACRSMVADGASPLLPVPSFFGLATLFEK